MLLPNRVLLIAGLAIVRLDGPLADAGEMRERIVFRLLAEDRARLVGVRRRLVVEARDLASVPVWAAWIASAHGTFSSTISPGGSPPVATM